MKVTAVIVAGLVLVAAGWLLLWDGRGTDPGTTGSRQPTPEVGSADAEERSRSIDTERFTDPGVPAEGVVDEVAALVIEGRVVDEQRRAAAGVAVRLIHLSSPPVTQQSGSDGRFRFAIAKRPAYYSPFTVVARHEDGRTAIGSCWIAPSEPLSKDLGTLVLKGGGAQVLVRSNGAPVPGAHVMVGNSSPWFAHGPFVADENGRAVLGGLGPGEYEVVAFKESLRGQTMLDVPSPGAATVTLEPTRDVEVLVRYTPSGRPVPGIYIDVWASRRAPNRASWPVFYVEPPALTDAQGRSVVRDIPLHDPDISVMAHGFFRRPIDAGTRTRATGCFAVALDRDQVVIDIAEGKSIRFPVDAGEVPGPEDGTVVRVSPYPGRHTGGDFSGEARMVGANLELPGVTEGVSRLLARSPEGHLAELRLSREGWRTGTGAPTSFRTQRSILVRVKERDGTPVTGLIAELQNYERSTALDENGEARFTGLHGRSCSIALRQESQFPYEAERVGTVDIEKEDAVLDVVLDRMEMVLRFSVDGERRLPADWGIYLRGANRSPVDEDTQAGELRFSMLPKPRAKFVDLRLTSLGYPTFTRRVPVTQAADPTVIEIDLSRGATLRVVVVPPGDGVLDLGVERWDAGRERWTRENRGGRSRSSSGEARTERTFIGLAPGRLRTIDGDSGAASDPVELKSGSEELVNFDLSAAGWLAGRIVAPHREDLRRAQLDVSGENLTWTRARRRGVRVGADGSFRLRVPGDRRITLEARHPLLVPDPDAGRAVVTAARGDIVLRLVPGATASFRLAEPGRPSNHRVSFYRGEPVGDAVHTCAVVYKDGVGRIGGVTPGSWTLWCDLSPHAPLVLRNVNLAQGETDLGTLRPGSGATIVLTVHRREGDRTRIQLTARRTTAPACYRSAASRTDQAVIRLPGLAPGTFEVWAGGQAYTVTSDGQSEIPLTLDLR